jgi:ubiquitin carboxyl-terminal hydrolase L3
MSREYRKHFIPLESDPDVFTSLIHALGAPSSLVFEDVWSLDEPELLPHPAYALILIFPTTDSYERRKALEEEDYQRHANSDESIVWFQQTINNACGLYGVLHALSNGVVRDLLGTPSCLSYRKPWILSDNARPGIDPRKALGGL